MPLFAVSAHLKKIDLAGSNLQTTSRMLCSYCVRANEEAALGWFTKKVMTENKDFSIDNILCIKVDGGDVELAYAEQRAAAGA